MCLREVAKAVRQNTAARLKAWLPEHWHDLTLKVWLTTLLWSYCAPDLHLQGALLKLYEVRASWSDREKSTIVILVAFCPLLYALLSRFDLLTPATHLRYLTFWLKEAHKDGRDHVVENAAHRDPVSAAATVDKNHHPDHTLHRSWYLPEEMDRTSIITGLSTEEAAARRQVLDTPKIRGSSSPISVWKKVLKQDTTFPLFIGEIILTATTSDYKHLVALCNLVPFLIRDSFLRQRHITGMLSWYYRNQARTAFALRDGGIIEIDAADLVPGDIVHVSEGTQVPADGKVIYLEGQFVVDQSALTGELLTVEKSVENTCFATTRVVRGQAFLLIEATGLDSYVGQKISEAERGHAEFMPSRKRRLQFSATDYTTVTYNLGLFWLGYLSALLVVMISGSLCQQLVLLSSSILLLTRDRTSPLEAKRAAGASILAKHGCIPQIRRLDSINALAGVDTLLCSRTGIVTENWLTINDPIPLSGTAEEIMTIACLSLASGARSPDAVENGFLRALKRFPRAKANIDRYRIIDSEPWNAGTKVLRSLAESPSGRRTLCVLGAVQAVFRLCSEKEGGMGPALTASYWEIVRQTALQGCRSFGVARRIEEGSYIFLGVVPCYDPTRSDAQLSIALARQLGVTVKIMTGDADSLGHFTADEAGLDPICLNAKEVAYDTLLLAETRSRIEASDIITECDPAGELRVLTALQMYGHRVATTGSGIEHITALDRADCGIAVEGASMGAQAAADMVMIRAGISRLVDVIGISRQIFQRQHNMVVELVTQQLHTLIVMLFYYHETGRVLSLAPILMWHYFIDMVSTSAPRTDDISYSLRPVRWSVGSLLSEVMGYLMPLVLDTWAVTSLSSNGSNSPESTRLHGSTRADFRGSLQLILLSLMVSHSWLSIVIASCGRPWTCSKELKQTLVLMGMQLMFTIACTSGILGNDWQIELGDAFCVWSCSILNLGPSCLLSILTSRRGRVQRMN